jgi:hypothetical protein
VPRPRPAIACCLCGKTIPRASDAHALDGEWERRFPRMTGILACGRCVRANEWSCRAPGGGFAGGHIPSVNHRGAADFDSWSHILGFGTHAAMVIRYPRSGLLQGAGEYLRAVARSPRASPGVRQRLQTVLDGRPEPVTLRRPARSG